MRIDKQGTLDAKEIYNYQRPPDESTYKGDSEFGLFHGSDIKWERDFSKCPECGGLGRKWIKRKFSKRLVECECATVSADQSPTVN